MSLPPVQMFWSGRPLNEIERLSISSFLHNGHDVHLYSYDAVEGVPDGVATFDACDVLPAYEFERLRARGVPLGVFSDLFRALLLYGKGGWWIDCDVVCLRPFDFVSDFVFGWQDAHFINGAVMRLPQGSRAAERLITLAKHPNRWMRGDPPRRIARKTRDLILGRREMHSVFWGATGPLAVTTVVTGEHLLHHAMATEVFYPVHWEDSALLFRPGNLEFSTASYAVHLWNEVRGSRQPRPGSPICLLIDRYGL